MIIDKIKNDKDIAAKFQKDPVATVESLLGVDLPNDQVEALVDFIKAKLDVSGITFQAQISAEDMIVG